MKKSVSIREIAKYCKVSVSTVSRALRDHQDINPETKEKVLRACHQLAYIPDQTAIRLRSNQSRLVAGIMPDYSNELFIDKLYFLRQMITAKGWEWHLLSYHSPEEISKLIVTCLGEKVSGLVVFGRIPQEVTHLLKNRNCGVVIYDGLSDEWDCIWLNREEGVCEGVSHLIQRGSRQILLLGASLHSERGRGYTQALQTYGIPVQSHLIWDEPFGKNLYIYGYHAMLACLEQGIHLDGVCCVNDACAIGAMRALIQKGFKIPEQVRVLGFDNIQVSAYITPALTTIAQPIEAMASYVAELLEKQLIYKDYHPTQRLLKTSLLIRETT